MSNGIERIGLALWGERWQAEMGRALNVSRDTVQDWKNGRMNPRPGVYSDLLKIARERQGQVGSAVTMLAMIVKRLSPSQLMPEPDPDLDPDRDYGPEMR